MDFEEEDLRPFSGVSRPQTSANFDQSRPMTAGMASTDSGFLQSRPMTAQGHDFDMDGARMSTARPKTGYKQVQSRIGTAMSHRGDFQGDMSRPFSRAGSAIGDRPGSTFGRPTTGRLGSAIGARVVPGTASRALASAMQNRPMSRGGIGLQTPVSVMDRPVTQQGLTGMRTGTGRGPQRQFQDKSYYMGLLRTKMIELQTEVNKLHREIASAQEEQSTYLAYDSRVKELAAELTEQQGVLADYNLLVDKLNTDTDRLEVEQEAAELKAKNDEEQKVVETLFEARREKERIAEQLELEIEAERNMADNLVAAMNPEIRDKYLELKDANTAYQVEIERMNQELDALNTQRAAFEDELAMSALKREAVVLYEQLREAEEKRDQLLEEENQRGTPAQERERLLQQVKDDNAEIATMERQIAETQEQIRHLKDEQNQIEEQMEEHQSERNQKYRELRKREETMDQFLNTFEDNKAEEQERINRLELAIEETAAEISKNLGHIGHLPTSKGFRAMKEDLSFKEGETEKSRNTLENLNQEQTQLKLNLEKIEALEDKIRTEMSTLKDKMKTMEEEMIVFNDLERLRNDAEEKRAILESQREQLSGRKISVAQNLAEVKEKHDALKKTLADNETHVQLTNLEKKWSHLDQNNFAIEEFISNKKAEMNFEPMKNKVIKMQRDFNKILIESTKQNPMQ